MMGTVCFRTSFSFSFRCDIYNTDLKIVLTIARSGLWDVSTRIVAFVTTYNCVLIGRESTHQAERKEQFGCAYYNLHLSIPDGVFQNKCCTTTTSNDPQQHVPCRTRGVE